MGDTCLVEIRLARTRWQIKETSRAIARLFGVEACREHHPHITLYGPFTLDDPRREQDLLDAVAACAPHKAIPFFLGEWEYREGMHGGVVAFSIMPSPELANLVAALSQSLSGLTVSLNPWDRDPGLKWFHATIANRLPPGKAGEIMEGLAMIRAAPPAIAPARQGLLASLRSALLALPEKAGHFFGHQECPVRPVLLDDAGIRITVMHNNDILGEYDLLQQRWLTREEIHDPRSWQESMAQYRRSAGFELLGLVSHPAGETFLISDLHLGHANSIRYCSRPFVPTDVSEMDRVLVNNWNYGVSPHDRVYFLGDLRYGRHACPAKEYPALLNGAVTFIGGNHDRKTKDRIPYARITCDGREFLLVHDPKDAPAGYAGWVVHGHHHNNDLRAFPYIDPVARRINVSAEVIGYYPVSIREICETLRNTVIPSGKPLLLRYPYVREDSIAGSRMFTG
jgi:calcineurin-like phosphoesterase family protein